MVVILSGVEPLNRQKVESHYFIRCRTFEQANVDGHYFIRCRFFLVDRFTQPHIPGCKWKVSQPLQWNTSDFLLAERFTSAALVYTRTKTRT